MLLGDMHTMPFPDDSFDAVILGWVLAYSEDPARAAREVVRVTRNGGVIAVGVEHNPLSQEDIIRQVGYLPGASKRITSCAEILQLFGRAVHHVYFNHVVAESDKDRVGSLCVIFSIAK